jgi:oligoribonuclease NrnB/cAMP/cGMP phosphodiesterase (DHH superfamily)
MLFIFSSNKNMSFIPKPNRVNTKEIIKSETINTIISALEIIENYLENFVSIVKDHLEYGKIMNIDTSSIGTYIYDITFNKPFTNVPYVFLSTENLDPNVDISISAKNVSTNGFQIMVKTIRVHRNTYCHINWFAVL